MNWKPLNLDGCAGLYEISPCGTIRLTKQRAPNYPVGYTLKPNLHKQGYYRITLTDHNGDHANYLISKLVAFAWLSLADPLDKHYQVIHLNGDLLDDDFNNLAVVKASSPKIRGERHGGAKLTDAQRHELAARYQAGESARSMAADYGISPAHAWAVAAGKGGSLFELRAG